MLKELKLLHNKNKYGELNWSIDSNQVYKSFENLHESTEWGKNHYQDWADNYKLVMKTAERYTNCPTVNSPIECYCGQSYREINNYLRNNKDSESKIYREVSDVLVITLCSAPRIPENIVVYRMVCKEFIEELINNNKEQPPSPTREKGFLSTSLFKNIVDEEEYYAQDANLLKIYVDKNSIGVYVNSITYRSEEEILFLPDGYLALVNYPYRDKITNKIIYECKLITFP
jgi:hypothetical protein